MAQQKEVTGNGFRGEYEFLSNMYATDVKVYGRTFSCSETAFQFAKCENPEEAEKIASLSGREAKAMGRRITMRSDWDSARLPAMEEIVHAKFQDPEMRSKLLSTEQTELVEYNTWHDTYWGVDIKTNRGENHLGKILMQERESIQKELTPIAIIQGPTSILLYRDKAENYFFKNNVQFTNVSAKEAYHKIQMSVRNQIPVRGMKAALNHLRASVMGEIER